jgi:hypothetical protein
LLDADGGLEVEPGRADELLETHMRRQVLSSSALTVNADQASIEALVALWRDPEFAERMITSRGDRLSIEQVRLARYEQLLGRSARDIADSIGARSAEVVQRLLDGKTYVRVRGIAE